MEAVACADERPNVQTAQRANLGKKIRESRVRKRGPERRGKGGEAERRRSTWRCLGQPHTMPETRGDEQRARASNASKIHRDGVHKFDNSTNGDWRARNSRYSFTGPGIPFEGRSQYCAQWRTFQLKRANKHREWLELSTAPAVRARGGRRKREQSGVGRGVARREEGKENKRSGGKWRERDENRGRVTQGGCVPTRQYIPKINSKQSAVG
ncbi:hypothetical protein KM043_014176 [Ampulex compressa]|nr:hypothetical protein KM043_014176 [Ampulex compressa]